MILHSLSNRFRHYRSGLPLYLVLVVPFVATTVGTAALIGGLSYRNGQHAIHSLANQSLDNINDRVVQELETYLQTPLLINRLNADAVRQQDIDLQNLPALEAALFNRLQQFSQVSAILFASPDGVFRGVERSPALNLVVADPTAPETISVYRLNPQGQRQQIVNRLYGADIRRDRPWYQRAAQTGKAGWNPIFRHGPYDTLTLNASQPVYAPTTNRLLGVFSVHVRLDYLSEFLHRLATPYAGQIMIVDPNGELVATSTLESLHQTESRQGYHTPPQRLAMHESRHDLTRSLGEYLRERKTPFSASAQEEHFQFSHGGQHQFVHRALFRDDYGLQWQIFTIIPKSTFTADLQHELFATTLFSLLGLGLAIAAGLTIANRLTTRISRLEQASRQLAAGDLDQCLPTDSPVAEVNGLSHSFNQMADQLRQSFDRINTALLQSEAKFTSIFRANPEPTLITTFAEGRILEINESALTFFGFSREAIVGRTALEVGLWHDLRARQQFREQLQQKGKVSNLETTTCNHRGEAKSVLISADLQDIDGQLCAIAVIKDITDFKSAQDALRQTEERYQAIVEDQTELICRFLPDGTLTFVNSAYSRYFDRSEASLIGINFIDLVPVSERGAVKALLVELHTLSPEHPLMTQEHSALTPSGQVVWQQWTNRAIFNAQGHLIEFQSVGRDITERKQLEQALQSSVVKLNDVLNGVRSASIFSMKVFATRDWQYEYHSSGCNVLYGYTPQELHDDRFLWLSRVYAPDLEAVIYPLFEDFFQERIKTVEYRFHHRNGSLRWISSTYASRYDPTAQCWIVTGIDLDITDRKAAELALQQAQARYSLATRAAKVGVWEWNLKTKQCYIDPNIKALIGYGDSEISNYSIDQWMALIHPDDRIYLEALLQAPFNESRHEYVFEHRLQHKDGHFIWLFVRGELVQDAEGNPEILIGTSTDISERKHQEQQYRLLFESNPNPMWIYGLDTLKFLAVNQAALEKYGYSEAEFLAMRLIDIRPLEDIPLLQQALWDFNTSNSRSYTGEWRHRKRNGEVFDVEIIAHDVEWQGQPARFALAKDISDRKAAELALQQSEARLKEAQRVAQVGSWEFDVDTQTLRWSEEIYRILGIDCTQEPTLSLFLDCIVEDDREAMVASISRAVVDQRPQELEYRIRHSDGSIRYLVGRSQSVVNEQNRVVMLYGTSLDITDRKLIELSQQRALQQLTHHIETSPLGTVRWNREFQIELWSKQAEAIFGWTADEVMGKKLHDWTFVYEDDRSYVDEVAEHLFQGMSQVCSNRNYRKDGSVAYCEWYNSVLLDDQGQLISILSLVQDVSDRKQAELELVQAKEAAEAANVAKSIFLANMSHELRTPLNVILGYAQLLGYDASLSPEHQDYLRSIYRSGNHLLALINDVLDLSKIEAGRLTLDEKDFNLIELVQTLREMFWLRAESKGLEFVLECSPDLPKFITADANKLRQVLINLLSNAVKFTQTGHIALRIRLLSDLDSFASPPLLYLEVSDTGVGIAPEELDTIFEAFCQAKAGKLSTEGTGLGLAISQRFVRIMGGEFAVESTPEQGSCFSFWIPIKIVDANAAVATILDRPVIGLLPGQRRYRILVVDDQPANCHLLAELLRKADFEVREAATGAEAIRQWQVWQPDLIWMDIRMSEMTGYEALQRIRTLEHQQNRSSIPIIALTAQAYQEDRDRAIAAGFTDFVIKPFETATIFQQMATHLGVQYQYAEGDQSGSELASTKPQPLQPSDLRVMPAEWVAALNQAALNCSSQEAEALIAEVPPQHATLIYGLKELIHNFEFEVVMMLSQPL